MLPLLNIPKDQIPEFHSTTSFPKKSHLVLASIFLTLPLLILVLSLGDAPQPELLVTIPLFALTTPYFIQEKRRQDAVKKNMPIVGVFFNDDALLWRIKENVAHYIPRTALQTFQLKGKASIGNGAGNGWLPQQIELHGSDFHITIENASEYELAHLIHFLHTWKPDLEFDIDTKLSDYDLYTSFPKKPEEWIKI